MFFQRESHCSICAMHQKECTNKGKYGRNRHLPVQESTEIRAFVMQIYFLKLHKNKNFRYECLSFY